MQWYHQKGARVFELRYLGEVLGWATFLPYDLSVTLEPHDEEHTDKLHAAARHLDLVPA